VKRVKTPVRIQLDSAECGAACLGIILEFLGSYVPPSVLRAQCEVSREGSNAAAIVRAARTYDVDCKGYSLDLHSLSSVTLPAIIHWRMSHFVVLEGFNQANFWINNPAVGRYKVSLHEFSQAFTGISLCFHPLPTFRATGRKSGLASKLWGRTSGYRSALSYCILAAVLAVFPVILFAVGCKVFIDSVIIGGDDLLARPITWILAIAVAFQVTLVWMKHSVMNRMRFRLSQSLALQYTTNLLNQNLLFFTRRYPAELAGRVQLNSEIAESITHGLTDAVCGIATAMLVLLCLMALDVRLASVLALFFIANVGLIWKTGNVRAEISQQLGQSQGKEQATIIETISSIDTVKSSGMERFLYTRWHNFLRQSTQQRIDLMQSNAWLTSFTSFFSLLATTAVIGGGVLLVITGRMSIGSLVAFQVLLPFIANPLADFVRLAARLQIVGANLSRLDDVAQEQESTSHVSTNQLDSFGSSLHVQTSTGFKTNVEASIEVCDLSFGFGHATTGCLNKVSFNVSSRSWLGITGVSGSGKSTLARILARLYQPSEGSIKLNGADIRSIDRDTWARIVGFTDQQTVLYPGTIREHLLASGSKFDDEYLLEMLDRLQMGNAISRLPNGLGTICRDGEPLSGGEVQRLDIARVLLQKPLILILDEVTSGLDASTEQSILAEVKKANSMTVLVSHRPAVLTQCDIVLFLENGSIRSIGSHSELRENDDAYRRLVGEWQ